MKHKFTRKDTLHERGAVAGKKLVNNGDGTSTYVDDRTLSIMADGDDVTWEKSGLRDKLVARRQSKQLSAPM